MQTKKELLKKAKEFNRVISKVEAKIENLRGQKMSKEIKRELLLFIEKRDDYANALGNTLREIEAASFPSNNVKDKDRDELLTHFNEALHKKVLFIRYLGGYVPKYLQVRKLEIAKTIYP